MFLFLFLLNFMFAMLRGLDWNSDPMHCNTHALTTTPMWLPSPYPNKGNAILYIAMELTSLFLDFKIILI